MGFDLRRAVKARLSVRWAASLALVAAIALPAAQVTLAVHDTGVMEMDGNIADDAAVAGTDWAALFDSAGVRTATPLPAGTEVAHFFKRDFTVNDQNKIQPDTSYFQPSTKDFQAINPAGGSDVWACTTANVADKDEIMNGYALLADAADPGGGAIDRFAWVGMERFDNSGNAFFGVWLFQSTIGCTPDGKFTGAKTAGTPGPGGAAGDVLVLINFEGGGTDPANTHITAFEYVGSGGNVPGAPQFDLLTAGAGCTVPAPTGDDVCAVVATTTFSTPWPFLGKGGTGTQVAPNEFVEGGFNLSDLFQTTGVPCFSSILIETRSSSSLDATLKDYVLGDFETCGDIKISKDAVPDSAQNFTFSTTGGLTPSAFCLDDDGSDTAVTTAPCPNNTDDLSVDQAFTKVQAGKAYTITETPIPAGWALTLIACTVTHNGAPGTSTIQFGTSSAGPFHSTFQAGDNTVRIDLVAGDLVDCKFTDRTGSLVLRKEAKNANTAATNDLLGGATFTITPVSPAGAAFDVTDNAGADQYSTAGMICLDTITAGSTFSIVEKTAPANYAPDPATKSATAAEGSCASRSTAAGSESSVTPDTGTPFVNTPLSQVQVIFTSLAGAGVTRSAIVCSNGGGTVTPVSENGGADPAFDDTNETFTNLRPGLLTCTIDIDP